MRAVMFGLVIVIAALATGVRSGSAQGYNNRWCTDGAAPGEGGNLECSYYTLEQCLAGASGRGLHCVENPDILWGRARGSNADQRGSVRPRNN